MPVTRISQPSRTLLFLALITLSATALGFFSLTRDNGWGDDFAGYILQAQSIVAGNMDDLIVRNTFTILNSSYNNNPANYPWGFPLLLAPVYALVGIKILAFKSVLVLCHALLVPAAFLLARTRIREADSLILASVIAFNAVLITEGQGEVLSDIPFTLFAILSLWLMLRSPHHAAPLREDIVSGILIGLSIFMAAFIRPNGFLLLVPLAVVQARHFFNSRETSDRRVVASLLVPWAVLGAAHLLQAMIFPGSPLRNIAMSLRPEDVWRMLHYYLPLPAYFFRHIGPAAWAIYGIQMLMIGLSLVAHWKRDLPLHGYVLATLIMYIAFPYAQGVRYLYPVWPVLLIFTFDGMRVLAERVGPAWSLRLTTGYRVLWGAIAVISLGICASLAWVNIAAGRSTPGRNTGAFSPGTTEMFDFVRHHTPDDSVVIFFKPRVLRLRTDRDTFLTTSCEDLSRADYIIILDIAQTHDQIEPDRVRGCNPAVTLTPVYEKDLFIVYEIGPTAADGSAAGPRSSHASGTQAEGSAPSQRPPQTL